MATQPFVQLRCAYASCGNPFTPLKYWQRFCSKQCKNAFHTERTRLARAQFKRNFEQ